MPPRRPRHIEGRHPRRGLLVALSAAVSTIAFASEHVAAQPAPNDDVVAVDPAQIVDAGGPSVDATGRWIVFGATVAARQTVLRTDRTSGATVELSTVPAGLRPGATLHPRISADGCVVVAITEIPFDLFRDNDRDLRWDVYRLVVPECGGQVNGWELVSAADRTGIARDDVFTDSPPTVTGSGAQIAYVHLAPGAGEGIATISVVDVTVPIGEPGRVQQVAGMPVEAPGGAYLYRGARKPVISQNGRHLAFVSDTTASSPLPGWGVGPERGDFATSQVYVWDRGVEDQRRSVRLVSGRGDVLSAAGADDPDISESGRIVAFTSRDRALVQADLHCQPDCPLQVYRFDRDTDRNGIFDEPARRAQLAIVSAVDAGVVEVGVPEGGNRSSWAPAVNADGSQIAFVTDATNLLPSQRSGGGGTDDGDLLVAEFELGEVRRVLDGADTTAVPGAHGSPALSKTGEVLVFDTMAARAIAAPAPLTSGGGRSIVAVAMTPRLSLAALDFGTVLKGFESTELYAKVLNAGPAAFEPTSVTTSSPNFTIKGGSCFRGIIVAAGASCQIKLTFNPTADGDFRAELRVTGGGPGAPSVVSALTGAAGEPALLTTPGGIDLDDGVVGTVGDRAAIDIGNIGYVPARVTEITLTGANPADFRVVAESCTERFLNPDAKCAVEIEFLPRGPGYRSALLRAVSVIELPTGPAVAYTSAVVGGYAPYDPVFLTDRGGEARPGGLLGVGGSGFPSNAAVTIAFKDGGAPFATVDTTDNGTFLAQITLPGRIRIGPRELVASAPGGVVSSVAVDIRGRVGAAPTALPGFGTG